MLNTIQCEVAQTTSNNMNINKTVINLDMDSQLQRLQHSHSPKHENQHGITSNSNTTVPSISISASTSSSSSSSTVGINGIGINGIGTTSSTPIDLTRSNSHSYQTSVATSNPVSGSSSPTIPKLVNQHHVMESNGRKRPLDPPNYDINAISSAPQRKRQKIETNMNAQTQFVVNNSNVNHNNLLNLHNHNHVAGTNPTFTSNPLNNLQRSLLAGKQNLLLNPAQKVKKPIDVTLVQLVQYLKSQFAKYQENQSQNQSQTTSVSGSTTPNQAHNSNNKQNVQHLLANYMQPGHHNNPQQLLMNMMNKNKAHNNTAMLQSLLRLKQQQQIQQNTEKQNALLNAINATRSAQTQTHNQQYNNNNNNNSGGLVNLMASLQNIQNINNANNSMNMLLAKNRNISNLVATNYSLSNTNTNSNANSRSHSNSNLHSQKKLKKPKKNNHIKNNIEIVTLVSDEDDASSKLKSKLKKKRRNKKKRKSAKAEIISNAVHSEISIKSMTRRKRKRKRSPSATSTRSRSTVSAMNSDGSDESYKYMDAHNGDNEGNKVRQRKKRMCNIDKEFDAEERMIAYREDMLNCAEPISGNAYIVAYAESLHLGDMKLLENECFPVLKHMPRSALIKYCDYYKLRYSKRSKDNRLLQIVTRHFILHNREKNKYKTTQEMEQDLFWHSVCYQENNNNVVNDSSKNSKNRNES